ncbi:MAG: PAS domain S-box protein [Pseudomonadota bacterium]
MGTGIGRSADSESGSGSLNWERFILGLKRTTKEFIDNVLENIIESIVVTNLEGRLISFNKFSEELFGYKSHEVLNRHIAILGASEPDVLGHIRRNEPFRSEIVLKTKGGKRFPAHVRCVPLTDEADRPIGMVGVARDLTREKEKERTDREMARLQAFNEKLIASLNDGVQIIESSGIISFANKRLEDLLEFGKGELIGVHYVQIVTRECIPQFRKLVESREKLRGSSSFEARFVARSGRKIPVLVCASPFIGEERSSGIVVAITDVSEVEKLKEELCQSEKMSLVGTLASEVAHEINNPLGGLIMAVRMLLEMLEEGDFDPGVFYEELTEIDADAGRCRRIVQKLLEFSRRLPEGKMPLNLNDTAEEAMILVQRQAELDEVSFEKSYSPSLPLVNANSNDLQQVIINLVKNACDAMPNGGRIGVLTEEIDRDGCKWVSLSISDSGPGIPPEHRDQIFKSFFTTKDTNKGTGLGLAVSMRIIKEHGGDLRFRNREAGGAVFQILLPAYHQCS